MDLPMKFVVEVSVYRKTSKKLLTLVERLGQFRIGRVNYNEKEETIEFASLSPYQTFNISEAYFRNRNEEVEFKGLQNFRSVLNLIIAIADNDTDFDVSLEENSDEEIAETGIYSKITLSISTTSILQFQRILQHLSLLGLS